MNFPDKAIVAGPRSFVSQAEIDEKRKKRQEEWEKTRKADDPLEAPEEEYDARTLYERLQENKMKKEAEFEEAHQLKNLIRGLDSDEVSFLQHVDQAKMEAEDKKFDEEAAAIEEFKKLSSHLTQEEQEKRLSEFTKSLWKSRSSGTSSSSSSSSSVRKSHQASLMGHVAVKRKEPEGDVADAGADQKSSDKEVASKKKCETMKCIGILPGIGGYTGSDSSDSDNSDSDSDTEVKGGGFMLIPRVCKSTCD